jgi:NADH-quinone oxidoreductase subunit C
MAHTLQGITQRIQKALQKDLLSAEIKLGELCITLSKDVLVKVFTFLRDAADLQFQQLIDITAVDYPGRTPRFDVVYHLLSLDTNQRLRVKVGVEAGEEVPTITGVFACANWPEREVWDMFGIHFTGHPDLRRLLTDYGFEGHPLRKDFPLSGYLEVRYDTEQKRVLYEPVKLQQDFRTFDFESPWEGMTPPAPQLPGDEKVTTGEDLTTEKTNVSA